jgi:hypothetical protein
MAIVAEIAVTRESDQRSAADAQRIKDLWCSICPYVSALQRFELRINEPYDTFFGAF